MRIGINGFGRIGRTLTRVLQAFPDVELVAINDPAPASVMAHLLQFDSIHGRFPHRIQAEANQLTWSNQGVAYASFRTPAEIPWDSWGVQVVVESSGLFKDTEALTGHLKPGVKRVLLSVPPNDPRIPMGVMGVNDGVWKREMPIWSNASCTTNSAAHLIQAMDQGWGVESCFVTTIHSYTTDQRLIDAPHTDLRRARAALQSIVPTSTGAAKALTTIFPHLTHRLGGCGIRVPVPDGSLTDITFNLRDRASEADIKGAIQSAAAKQWKGLVAYSEDPLVGSDVIGRPESCVFDAPLTSVVGQQVKLVGWYDNEWGYANRLAELILRAV
jgi:glyceraldehyde 3-phosphate dehydrogenase